MKEIHNIHIIVLYTEQNDEHCIGCTIIMDIEIIILSLSLLFNFNFNDFSRSDILNKCLPFFTSLNIHLDISQCANYVRKTYCYVVTLDNRSISHNQIFIIDQSIYTIFKIDKYLKRKL